MGAHDGWSHCIRRIFSSLIPSQVQPVPVGDFGLVLAWGAHLPHPAHTDSTPDAIAFAVLLMNFAAPRGG